jgi:hypothetical protein
MDSHDEEMANYPDLPAVTAFSQMENIKRILEQNLAEVNRSIARGFGGIKQDLTMVSTRRTTSITHINTVPDRNASGSFFRTGFQNAKQAFLGGTTPEEQEVDRLEKEIETHHETHKRLEKDKDRSTRDKERYLRDIQELQTQLYNANLTSGRIGKLESELDSMRLQNKQLSENCSRFRNMIIGKGADDTESITDPSIKASFIDLRAQIQRIVFKYFKVDKKDSSIKLLVDATKKQREFFMAFNDCSTGTQMMNRVRSKIFELVADEFLCTPCFGLDGVRPFGEVETGLKMFETELGKSKKGTWASERILARALIVERRPWSGYSRVADSHHEMCQVASLGKLSAEKRRGADIRLHVSSAGSPTSKGQSLKQED